MLEKIMMKIPRRYRCLFPHTLADGTKNMAEAPTPKRKYPVSLAICVNGVLKYRESVMVFAARIGPRQVAKMETMARIKSMPSRFHSGQFLAHKLDQR
jgi:hypothetical protein